MPDPARLTATEAVCAMRAGSLSPEALMEACLDRLAAREPERRAMAWFDPDQARAAAAAARSGPLHGLPMGVKDVLDTADLPTEYNSPIWRGHRPRADCAPVALARAAGGVMLGKTVTTEFAARTPGPTTNPHDPARSPGGSSSGSAAGVADFFFPLAFGTQTAGSIIRPAAFCGVVGFKPSFGLIHRIGMKLMSDSLDTVGVMARSVADCALFAGALAGRDLGDPDARPHRAGRVGICRTPNWPKAAPETQALLEHAAASLRRSGAEVEERELPRDFDALADAQDVVMKVESWLSLAWECANHRAAISAPMLEMIDWAERRGAAALDDARATLLHCRSRFPTFMEGLDVLVTPAAPGEAPLGLGGTGDPGFNFLWTSLHVPCLTVPAGTGPSGMPLGIQIVGRRGEDRQTLAWGRWVQDVLQ